MFSSIFGQGPYTFIHKVGPDDVAVLREYFGAHEYVRRRQFFTVEEIEAIGAELFKRRTHSREAIKRALIILAHQEHRRALEILEWYLPLCPTELLVFAQFARQEADMWQQR